jgi:hypothetical protein
MNYKFRPAYLLLSLDPRGARGIAIRAMCRLGFRKTTPDQENT